MSKFIVAALALAVIATALPTRSVMAADYPSAKLAFPADSAAAHHSALLLGLEYAPLFVEQYGEGSDECWQLALSLGLASQVVEGDASLDALIAEADCAIAALLCEEQECELAALLARLPASEARASQEPAPGNESAEAAPLQSLVFHVPVNFNDGSPVPPDLTSKLEHLICETCGGFTLSLVEGAWEDGGMLYREPMRRYLVGIVPDKLDAFTAQIESLLKGDYAQLAVWIEVDGAPEIR